MYEDLNDKQIQILEYMKSEISKKGYPPSVREICEAVGLRSTSTAHSHLSKLEAKGYIRKDATKPRAIEILNNRDEQSPYIHKEIVNVPIVGKVTAGQPILAVENIEDTFPLPLDFVDKDNTFILTIKGDSMIEDGIHENDYVVVRQQSSAKNGDIVVALIDDSATVKRFYRESDHIRLQPANAAMDPILLNDVKILGKVTGVFRKL